jgi:enamine deaminase RidA (YjgF/YER057c/UK114 family)
MKSINLIHAHSGGKVVLTRSRMSIQAKLLEMGIQLPEAAAPVGAFVPYFQTGSLVFLSGHIAKKDGKPWVGQLGGQISVAEGKMAARSAAIDLLATLKSAVGDLEKVTRIVKLMVLVNSTPAFTEQHLVANGASEFFGEIFGPAGISTRSSFGVAQVPFGSCIEIDLIAEVG